MASLVSEVRPRKVTASSRMIPRCGASAGAPPAGSGRPGTLRPGDRPPPALPSSVVRSASERRELLKGVYEEARECTRCPLHQTRTKVVFGAGNADADLMFVGEAPGATEDRMGLPFVGQAGKLLDNLLAEIGLERADVWICNVLKCRPPDNRDPQPDEIESCEEYLRAQVDLIEPTVICTLGNFSTKLLRADMAGISRVHGHEEVRVVGSRAVRLYPLYHPAAALYTPSMLETLRSDFHRIPQLIALGPPEQPGAFEMIPEVEDDVAPAGEELSETDQPPAGIGPEPVAQLSGTYQAPAGTEPEPVAQLGLF
jgi:uracil-DNA glycosylase family 4